MMKHKLTGALLCSVFAYFLVTVSIYMCVAMIPDWYGLIAGSVLMLVAIPLHILGHKIRVLYLISSAFNYIGCGLSVGAYYACKSIAPDLSQMLLVLLLCEVFLFAAGILTFVSGKITYILLCCVNILLLIPVTVAWIKSGQFLYSFAFFMIILAFFFVLLFGRIENSKADALRDISFSSFGVFIILTVIVVAILSEGDFLDGLDLNFGGDSRKKKRKVK